jgi:outer membrane cobalamin receptor
VPGFVEVSSQIERNVAIRGIHASSTYHFVVLLDGLPMNDFLFGAGSPDSFSLEFAERVEVIRGPARRSTAPTP